MLLTTNQMPTTATPPYTPAAGFVVMDITSYRGVVWGAAVWTLAAEGWLPDDAKTLRRACEAWHSPSPFRRALREAGLRALDVAWCGGGTEVVTKRSRVALAEALTRRESHDGAQLALQAWWDGCHSPDEMIRVIYMIAPDDARRVIDELIAWVPTARAESVNATRFYLARAAADTERKYPRSAVHEIALALACGQRPLLPDAESAVACQLRARLACPTIDAMLRP